MASVCIRVGVLFLVVASLSSREFLPRPVPPLPAVARQPESDPLTESNPLTESSPLTVADLQRRGTITFLMHHSAASSFLYRGEQMGFEYELALAFAKELGVELQVLTPPPDVELTSWLKTGKGDVIAGLFTDGAGHVEDAQRLARVLGYDPHCWEESMELVLPLLEDPAHYTQTLYGSAPGSRAVHYVNAIQKRYALYSQYVTRALTAVTPPTPPVPQAASAAG